MKSGIQISRFNYSNGTISKGLSEIAQASEDAGFSNLYVMDHFFQIHYIGPYTDPMLEGYTTLSFIAAKTKKIKLGTLVTGVIYREPALLLNQLTTLDVLSEGRAILGIGAAWNEQESNALGFNFPPVSERFERLEETLQIAKQMFSGDTEEFRGKYYHLEEPLLSPMPISKPHPEIMIGGGGEKKTLKLVAKYADSCNLFAALGTEELKRKLDILKEHCKDVGRDYNEIKKTVLVNVPEGESYSKVVEECKKLEEIGFELAIFGIGALETRTLIERFGKEVVEKIA